MAQIHQACEDLRPFLKCPEPCTLESQIDLIARAELFFQFLLSLIKELQRIIDSPFESRQFRLSNSNLDAFGKSPLGFLKFLMSCRLLTLRKEQLSPEDNWLNGFRSCFGRLIDQFFDFVPITLRLWPPLILRDQETS